MHNFQDFILVICVDSHGIPRHHRMMSLILVGINTTEIGGLCSAASRQLNVTLILL